MLVNDCIVIKPSNVQLPATYEITSLTGQFAQQLGSISFKPNGDGFVCIQYDDSIGFKMSVKVTGSNGCTFVEEYCQDPIVV